MRISRRDFLKLTSLLTASTLIQPGLRNLPAKQSINPKSKNILIIIFDALSVSNINFYGYPRNTMPHLTRLLDRATVYHNHYSSAGFTTPGTASLLTGRHPWEHQATKLGYLVKTELTEKNVFGFLDNYYSFAYTHNNFADIFLTQFNQSISHHEYYKNLFLDVELVDSGQWFNNLLEKDLDAAMLLKTRLSDISLDGFLYSLLFPNLLGNQEYSYPPAIAKRFPRGIPEADRRGPYTLEDSIDWTFEQCRNLPQPFLGYLHFYPPHYPYNTRDEFVNVFQNDGYQPREKPQHPIVIPLEHLSEEETQTMRRQYDEFILYADAEFHQLFSALEQQGILDNTLVILTSDHGEMFERKLRGHTEPYLFEPLVNIPLICFEPGQTERRDIYNLTSCIDLLPTLMDYTGHEIPAELPGFVLPGFGANQPDPHRTIYAMDAQYESDITHLSVTTLMMRRGGLKVIRYSNYADGYRHYGRTDLLDAMQIKDPVYFEVYDLNNDPEELNNLALTPSPEIDILTEELEKFYREYVEFPR